MGASARDTIPKAAADATTNASSASPHSQRDMTASVSRTSSVPCATTTVTSRFDTRPPDRRGVLDSKWLPDLNRAPDPSVRKRDVRERRSRASATRRPRSRSASDGERASTVAPSTQA